MDTFSDSFLPQVLRDIWICPLWKGGPVTDPAEYRPIALSSHIVKIIERVVRKQVVSYLIENDLLESSQHGSRSGCSTLTQLLEQYN